jgi:hypothetical protein
MDPSSASRDPTIQLAELACERCRYLLRGLEATGNCPECGLPIATSIEAEAERRRRRDARRWFKPQVIPTRPPLAESLPGWLRLQALGAALLAAVHVVTFLCAGVLWMPPLRVSHPDQLFIILAACYAAGAWLLSWPEPPSRDAGWRTAARRWGLRFFSLGPLAAAGLMWVSWNVVPWWDYERYRLAAAEALALVNICEWLVFDHLSLLAAGTTRPGLYFHYRAARYAACFATLVLSVYGPPGFPKEGLWRRGELVGCCFPAELIVFVYPTVLVAVFVPVLLSAARAARRPTRGAP